MKRHIFIVQRTEKKDIEMNVGFYEVPNGHAPNIKGRQLFIISLKEHELEIEEHSRSLESKQQKSILVSNEKNKFLKFSSFVLLMNVIRIYYNKIKLYKKRF